MPKTKHALHSLDETILKPIVIIATGDIKRYLGIVSDVWTIYDTKDALSKHKNPLGNVESNNTTTTETITIKYTEEPEDDNELALASIRPDMHPVYIDPDIGAHFIPIMHNNKVSINFNYSNKSKTKVQAIINKLRLRTSDDGMYIRHNLEYSYIMPYFTLELLSHINDLKNIREDVGSVLELDTYINSTFDDRADFLNSIDGDTRKTNLIIREKQIEVQGYITDSLHKMIPDYDEATNTWFINFNYEFIYNKPISLLLKYPIMVYNSLIASKFRTFVKDNMPVRGAFRTYGSSGLVGMFGLRKLSLDLSESKYYLTIPKTDDIVLSDPPSFTARMFSVLVKLDPDNLTSLFNIRELPGLAFKENVIQFILECEREFITKLHESMFYIELYKNDVRDNEAGLYLEEDGMLRTHNPMSLKATYRVMFSVVTDLNMISPEARERIRKCINRIMADVIDNNSNLETIIDSYVSLLNITDQELLELVKNSNGTGDIIFGIENRKWFKYKTKETMLVLTGALNEL